MYRPGGDADDHEDALLASARPGNCGHTGGGQPPPPTVPFVRHSDAVTVPEQVAPVQITVQEGVGAEVTAVGGGGLKGGHLMVVQRLWKPP